MSKPTGGTKGLYLSFDDPPTQIYFDVTVTDKVESVLEVTEHPVETGANISDYARLKLKRFSFEVIVSDTPIFEGVRQNGALGAIVQSAIQIPGSPRVIPLNPLGAAVEAGDIAASALTSPPFVPQSLNVLNWTKPFNAVGDMLNQLYILQAYAQVLQITTSKYTYKNVLLTSVEQTRDKDIGSGAKYKLEFKQLRQVNVQSADAPIPDQPRGNQQVNQGSKNSQGQTPPQIKSVAAYTADKALGRP